MILKKVISVSFDKNFSNYFKSSDSLIGLFNFYKHCSFSSNLNHYNELLKNYYDSITQITELSDKGSIVLDFNEQLKKKPEQNLCSQRLENQFLLSLSRSLGVSIRSIRRTFNNALQYKPFLTMIVNLETLSVNRLKLEEDSDIDNLIICMQDIVCSRDKQRLGAGSKILDKLNIYIREFNLELVSRD